MGLKVVCGADHAGYFLKESLKQVLLDLGHDVLDLGTDSASKSVDYPDYALKVVASLKNGEADFGLLICGSGMGMSMAANRHSGIRAALCHDITTARLSRSHNDANVLVLGERVMGISTAQDCLKVFLTTPFEGGRHKKRVESLG